MTNLLIVQSEYIANIPKDFSGYVATTSIGSCVVICALQENDTYVFAHILSAGWNATIPSNLKPTQNNDTTWALVDKWIKKKKGWFYFNNESLEEKKTTQDLIKVLKKADLIENSKKSPDCVGTLTEYKGLEIALTADFNDWKQNNRGRSNERMMSDGKRIKEINFMDAQVNFSIG